MRIVSVQKLRLRRGNGFLSHRYSAPLRVKHEKALAHISLKRSIEMLALQCAQRFPASPTDPDSSVFAELFPAPQPEPSRADGLTAKAKQMHHNWNPLGFLSDLSQQKSVTRFPPHVWQAFFSRSFGAPIPQMLAHAHSRKLCSCKHTFGRLFSPGVLERPSPRCLVTLTIARFTLAR